MSPLQVGFHFMLGREGSYRAARIDHEVNVAALVGDDHQMSLRLFISLQGSNAGISTPVAQ